MTHLALRHLTSDTDPCLSALFALYAESFPPEERKPEAQLRSMLLRPRYRFLVAEDRGSILGFAIVLQAEAADVALLEYFAVQPRSRGKGIGRSLLQQILHSVDLTRRPLLIETESDLEMSPEQALRRRRKQFYRSAGARELIGLPYLMPAVSTHVPPPMELMLFAQPMPASLPKQRLRQWLTTLYSEVYGQHPADPRLDQMFLELPETVAIA